MSRLRSSRNKRPTPPKTHDKAVARAGDTIRWDHKIGKNAGTPTTALVVSVEKPNPKTGVSLMKLKSVVRHLDLPVDYLHSDDDYEIISSSHLASSTKTTNKKNTRSSKAHISPPEPEKGPVTSREKIHDFNIGDRVNITRYEVGILRITAINELAGPSSKSKISELTVTPMNPNITIPEDIIRSDDPDLKFVCKAPPSVVEDSSIDTQSPYKPSNAQKQADHNTVPSEENSRPSLEPSPSHAIMSVTRATRQNTEKNNAIDTGKALTILTESIWVSKEIPASFHSGNSEDFWGSNPWPEGEGTWFKYHTSGGAFSPPSSHESTISTMNSKTKVVAWNKGVYRQTGNKPLSVFDENYDPAVEHHAYFTPIVELGIECHVCFLFKAIRRGCTSSSGTKISINSIVRLTDGTLLYIIFIWKDSNVVSPICNGDYMMSGVLITQEVVGGPLTYSWTHVSTSSSKFNLSSTTNLGLLANMTGTTDQDQLLEDLKAGCEPLLQRFLKKPEVLESNSFKLSVTGSPVAFYSPKKAVNVSDTDIDVVELKESPKLLELTPKICPSNLRRLLNGVQKNIVGQMKSQIQSHNSDLESLVQKKMRQQFLSPTQQTSIKTKREDEQKHMEMIGTLERNLTEAHKSQQIALDSQRLAEANRLETEKRCADWQKACMAALTARAVAAERNTELIGNAMNQQQVMCMAQGYIQQCGSGISVPDMTNFLGNMRHPSAPASVHGVGDSSVATPGHNTQLTLTNGDVNEHDDGHTSPKTAKLIQAKKLRMEYATLKRRIELFPPGEKTAKQQKIAELANIEATASALEKEGMA